MATITGIFANLAPIKIGGSPDFGSEFTRALSKASEVAVCTGYVAVESVIELTKLIDVFTNLEKFDLIVGMAKFDGLTRPQISALEQLDGLLLARNLGGVYLSAALPVHSKVSLFESEEGPRVILGSSNLGSLTRATRQYEVDVLVQSDEVFVHQIESFLTLCLSASRPFQEVAEQIKVIPVGQHPLENLNGVQEIPLKEIPVPLGRKYEIPVGVNPRSGLNVFFGKGRKSIDGRLLPRPWYEVELIVPKSITALPGYPTVDHDNGAFQVVTDDGYQFWCKTSGDYSKNLRSLGDLETLGRWIKGRLEQSGVLQPGDIATPETLNAYGRRTITLSKTVKPGVWLLDFSVIPND